MPAVHFEEPSISAQDSAVSEIDSGESSSLALYNDLDKAEPQVPAVHCEVPSVSVQAPEAVSEVVGKLSSLALFYGLHRQEPAPDESGTLSWRACSYCISPCTAR